MAGANVSLTERARSVTPTDETGNGSTGMERPSLDNPTWDFLQTNYTKVQLQKMCRDLGLTKIWVSKERLIEMILQRYQGEHSAMDRGRDQGTRPFSENNNTITSELRDIKDLITTKDAEIRELHELLKAANITINKLSDRLTSLEDQVERERSKRNEGTVTLADSIENGEGTLLLGDSNLSDVRPSDLASNCNVRTLKGANVDLVKCWITEKLNWKPSSCILMVGLQDILDGQTPSAILDNLGALVAELKRMNENMTIYLCQLLPTLKEDEFGDTINYFNDQLASWSSANGVFILECGSAFRFGNGEVDDMCFSINDEHVGVFLNRMGVVRFLTTISKCCKLFNLRKDWDVVKRMPEISDRNISRPNKPFYETTSDNYSNLNNDFNHNERRNLNRDVFLRNQRFESSKSTHEIESYRNPGMYAKQKNLTSNHLYNRGCHNCGEFNHRQANCRFDHRIRCGLCHSLGHKSRHCHMNRE